MRKLITWLLPTIGIVALGLAIYIAKIDHDLSVGLRRDFDRRFSDSGGRFLVISGGPAHAALTNDEKGPSCANAVAKYTW